MVGSYSNPAQEGPGELCVQLRSCLLPAGPVLLPRGFIQSGLYELHGWGQCGRPGQPAGPSSEKSCS